MKKLLILCIALLLLVAAGCSSKESAGEGEKKDAKKGKDEITVWTYPHYQGNEETGANSYEQDLQALVEDFEKENPDIKVKYEVLSWAEGEKKFTTALNAGNPPDIMFSLLNAKFINTGLALPLDEYMNDDELADIEQYGKDVYTYEGKLWGIPHYLSVHTWGGNRALLEAAGADVEKIQNEGWTWDEFYEIAKTATHGDTYGFVTQGQNEETFTHLLMNNGVRNQVEEDGSFTLTGEKSLETLNFIAKLRDEGIMPKETGGIDAAKADEMFNNLQAAIYGRTGPYKINEVNQRNADIDAGKVKGEKIDFVLLPMPHKDGEKESAYGGAGGLMLFKQKNYQGDEHTANAAKVLKHLTGTESSITAATMFLPPALKTGQEKFSDMLQLDTPNGKFIQRYLGSLTPAAKLTEDLPDKAWKVRMEVVIPNYQSFIIGDATAEETIEAWKKGADSIGLK
ncbi:ABC transporter substrate-binding protein [Bacillus sp. REN16]|uniref:ABC transporter substrate-binding protein n=1 Tax=Bacillus sp. REN16 TaxID=2887296 RepID=UPI001E524632|nr:sugar ABC transporter substrate-binding protein [Bacillus sp. REN16]MCC3356349.1 sugar ABC transporter substrate-binding protein [Bacillus sp. REN16]